MVHYDGKFAPCQVTIELAHCKQFWLCESPVIMYIIAAGERGGGGLLWVYSDLAWTVLCVIPAQYLFTLSEVYIS